MATRRPVLVNDKGQQLCFSSAEAQEAYVEAFADWERPGFDTVAKSRSMPEPLRWANRAGLTKAKRGDKPRYR